ncbi:molybdopterin molybdotransferase MoeA [Brevibacterium renqingii]|uniref:molybdopterin molybdotransferase MoeA n=1 Tax=Brevibacterium renqingii TaxID=2776916 RepID=UPI001AE0BFCD
MDPEDYSELIAHLAPVPRTEVVSVHAAIGRRIGTEVVATRSVPAFPTSAMDGFALDEAALTAAGNGAAITVVGDTPAGHAAAPLHPGSAVRVMTGAPVPAGSEAVVPVELTDAEQTGPAPSTIRIASLPETASEGWNIRSVGEDICAGEVVLSAGERLTSAGVGTLVMLGIDEIEVLAPARIGLVVTGDELRTHEAQTPSDEPDAPGDDAVVATAATDPTILNSNLPMLAAALRATGADVREAICDDDPSQLLSVLTDMDGAVDLVLTTGGISAGAYEVVRQALEGNCSSFDRVGMRPGSPQGYGRFAGLPLLHFPGTPQGAFLAFHLFARSLLTGRTLRTRWKKGLCAGPAISRHSRAVLLRPGAFTAAGEIQVEPRSRLRDFAAAEAIVRVSPGTDELTAGTVIDYLDC